MAPKEVDFNLDDEDKELTDVEFFNVMKEEISELEEHLGSLNLKEIECAIKDYSEELDSVETKKFDKTQIRFFREWLENLKQKRIAMGSLEEPKRISPEQEKNLDNYLKTMDQSNIFVPLIKKSGWKTMDIYVPTPEQFERYL